ncbi:MAG: D-alanine--D-alanine ligase [Polyangiaceae bacterium]|nr:D-alanine--D-alanine ligase [Myxococcales bacterium]MCB9586312.1 D-alanine--D-alanine ligase [Polyangiaceae bacterium]MCB9606989.1 D-alanine--D-alanine ligase [Polyangiaceae bacterium]
MTSRIAVVCGGPSSEAAVSRASGRGVQAALIKAGYEAELLELGRELPAALLAGHFDAVFPTTHGPLGEDGCLQGLLEVLGVPYVGSGVLGSATAASKPAAKRCFREAGLPVAPERVVKQSELEALDCDAVIAELGPAVVVKPSGGGSSIGVQRLAEGSDGAALREALQRSFEVDSEALIERFVTGLEVTCGVLEGDAGPVAFSPTLIHSNAAEWYDFKSRYGTGGSRHECPAPLPLARLGRIQSVAVAAFKSVSARDLGRMDFVVPADPDVDVTLLEVNTLPGMTATSLYPEAAGVAGIDFPELCRRLVERAKSRPARYVPEEVPLPD